MLTTTTSELDYHNVIEINTHSTCHYTNSIKTMNQPPMFIQSFILQSTILKPAKK